MNKRYYAVWGAAMAILALLMFPYVYDIIGILFWKPGVSFLRQLSIYQWAAVGAGVYFLISPVLKKNIAFLDTFSHEATHTFFAFIFGHRILHFRASDKAGGEITHCGGGDVYSKLPISLAPYCFPLSTWLLLPWRCLIIEEMRWIFDVCIGITLAFHIRGFCRGTRLYQVDITRHPLVISFAYIALAHVVNFCIFTVAFFPNMNDATHYGLISSIWRFLKALFYNAVHIVTLGG